MPDQRNIELKGTTSFTRNGTDELIHHTRVEIGTAHVLVEVSGCGREDEPTEPVSSDKPDVVQFVRDIDEALRVTAYRNRHVTPRFKPERKRRRRDH